MLPLPGFPYHPEIVQKYGSEGMLVHDVQKYRYAVCGAVSRSRRNGVKRNVGAVIGYDESVA
jgi:hypothetical protein